MNKSGRILGTALLLATTSLVAAGAAQATVISETESFNLLASAILGEGGTDSATLTFDKFDPSLGTLTGVKFTLDSFVSGTLNFSGSQSFSGGGGTLNIDADLGATGTIDIMLPLTTLPSPLFDFTDGVSDSCTDSRGDTGFVNCNGNEFFSFDFDGMQVAGSDDFGLFIGAASTFDAFVDLFSDVSCSGGDVCSTTGNAEWDLDISPFLGTLTVDYTFTEPPDEEISEPGSLALFGFGLAGFWLARRRRRPG